MAKFNKWFLLPLCIGVVLVVLGILMLLVIFPNIIEKEVIANVELKEDTLQWYRFKEIPFPFNFNVYLFEIENKDEVLQGKNPKVREVGPFVYTESRDKIIHGIEKDEVKYSDLFKYTFDEKASGDNSENQTITFLNAPLMAVVQTLEMATVDLGLSMEEILSYVFEDTNLFIDVKVKDLTFGGIKMCDPTRNTNSMSKLVCLLIMLMNVKLLKYNEDLSMSFSLFHYKTQVTGPYTLNTGLNDIDKLGFINSYKGEEYTHFWEGENNKCDKVNGFYTTYPPFMEEGSNYTVYSSDICKSIMISQTSLGEYKDISTFQFTTSEKSLGSDTDDCLCINGTKGLDGKNRCFKSAVLDMNTCLGVPVFMSHPHLMWAEEDLRKNVQGLSPSESKHNTIIDFQAKLGYPVSGDIRLQFNMILRPTVYLNEEVQTTKSLPRAVYPLLWVENNFRFTDPLIEEINTKLLDMLTLADAAQWTLIAVGGFVTIVALAFILFKCKK